MQTDDQLRDWVRDKRREWLKADLIDEDHVLRATRVFITDGQEA